MLILSVVAKRSVRRAHVAGAAPADVVAVTLQTLILLW